MHPRHRKPTRHPWRRLLWMAVALLLVTNQAAFRVGVPAAVGATSVACCGCAPGHCMCGHPHKSVARHCTRTGESCLCSATPVSHDQAGLVHADWPPTLLATVTLPTAPPLDRRVATAGTTPTGWCDPPPLPPPQGG